MTWARSGQKLVTLCDHLHGVGAPWRCQLAPPGPFGCELVGTIQECQGASTDAPCVRAVRVPREVSRADAPARDHPAALPRRTRAACALAPTGRYGQAAPEAGALDPARAPSRPAAPHRATGSDPGQPSFGPRTRSTCWLALMWHAATRDRHGLGPGHPAPDPSRPASGRDSRSWPDEDR